MYRVQIHHSPIVSIKFIKNKFKKKKKNQIVLGYKPPALEEPILSPLQM